MCTDRFLVQQITRFRIKNRKIQIFCRVCPVYLFKALSILIFSPPEQVFEFSIIWSLQFSISPASSNNVMLEHHWCDNNVSLYTNGTKELHVLCVISCLKKNTRVVQTFKINYTKHSLDEQSRCLTVIRCNNRHLQISIVSKTQALSSHCVTLWSVCAKCCHAADFLDI